MESISPAMLWPLKHVASYLFFPSFFILLPVALSLVPCLARYIYRLFFHPLSRFPGPKLAACSVWYEFYHDGVKGGQYTFEIGRMHERYGMKAPPQLSFCWSIAPLLKLSPVQFLGAYEARKGPIVRIGPNELHVNDREYVSELYGSSSRKLNRDEQAVRLFGSDCIFPGIPSGQLTRL